MNKSSPDTNNASENVSSQPESPAASLVEKRHSIWLQVSAILVVLISAVGAVLSVLAMRERSVSIALRSGQMPWFIVTLDQGKTYETLKDDLPGKQDKINNDG